MNRVEQLQKVIEKGNTKAALKYLQDPKFTDYLVEFYKNYYGPDKVAFLFDSIIHKDNVEVFDAFIAIPAFAFFLTWSSSTYSINHALTYAVLNNCYGIVEYLLSNSKVIAAIKMEKFPCDALRFAAELNDMKMVARLLQVPEIIDREKNGTDLSPGLIQALQDGEQVKLRHALQDGEQVKLRHEIVCVIAAALWPDGAPQMWSDPKIAQLDKLDKKYKEKLELFYGTAQAASERQVPKMKMNQM